MSIAREHTGGHGTPRPATIGIRSDDRARALVERVSSLASSYRRRRRGARARRVRPRASTPTSAPTTSPSATIEDLAGAARALARRRRTGRRERRSCACTTPRPASTVGVAVHGDRLVSDDMPFLVDSVTMAIDAGTARAPRHPSDRRACAARPTGSCSGRATGDPHGADGTARRRRAPRRRVVGAHRDRPQTTPRSSPSSSTTSRACSPTCAPPPSDWSNMLAATFRVVERARRAGRRRRDDDERAEGRALLHWMADQHFTFLGYRDIVPTPTTTRAPIVETGSALGDHCANAVDELRSSRPIRQGTAHAARAHQGARTRSTRAPPTLPRLRGRASARRRRQRHRRAPLPRPLHVDRVHAQPDRHPGAAPQGRGGRRSAPASRTTRTPARTSSRPRDATHATTSSRSASTSSSTPRSASCSCRSGGGCASSCTATRTAGSCRASCSCRATATPPRCACASRRSSSTRCTRPSRSGPRAVERLGARRLHFVLRVDAGRARRRSTSRARDGASAPRAGRGVDDLRDALVAAHRRGARPDLAARWTDAFPRAYQDDVRRDRGAVADVLDLDRLEQHRHHGRCGSTPNSPTA